MKRSVSFLLSAALATLALAASAAETATVPAWLDATASTEANAARAQRENVAPGEATAVLIQVGDSAPDAVAAVVKTYDNCDALYASVEEGARRAPDQAGAIADRILDSGKCPCSSDQLWSRSRLSHRLRIEARAEPAETPRACMCTSAVAEALARAQPGRAPEALELVLGRGRRCDCAMPAYAGIANALGEAAGPWIAAEQRIDDLRRDGGRVLDVVSDPDAQEGTQQRWLALGSVATDESPDCRAPLVTMGSTEQQAIPRCRAFARPDVAITRYRGAEGNRRAVELRGDGVEDIDLAASALVLDLYVDGKEAPERRVALTGKLPKDGRFVVSTKELPPGFAAGIDQEADELDLANVEAIVLRQVGEERWCASALAGVARRYNESPIVIAAPPEPEIAGEPRTDESNIDPHRGGDLASPN